MDPATPLEHDLRIILAIQSLRAFGYGFASVVLGAALADGGLSMARSGSCSRRSSPATPWSRSRSASPEIASGGVAHYVVRPFGAAGAGLLMQSVAAGAPFVVAGVLKSVYDVLVFAWFRRVPLRQEHRGRTEREAGSSVEPPGR